MIDFRDFVERLSHIQTADDAYNPFGAGDNPYNAVRRANVLRYFEDIAAHQPRLALITEAPGYRGMRLTGVPMASRRRLIDGLPALGLFGADRGYQDVPEPGFESFQGEQSGTILWGTLAEMKVVPLVWNSFPCHPHQSGDPLSNRKPRASEIAAGAPFVRELLEHFRPQKVIAVGNVAFGLLTELGVACVKIRHPAQGGKNDFVAGLRREGNV